MKLFILSPTDVGVTISSSKLRSWGTSLFDFYGMKMSECADNRKEEDDEEEREKHRSLTRALLLSHISLVFFFFFRKKESERKKEKEFDDVCNPIIDIDGYP